MNFLSVGDLALTFQNMRQNTDLKAQMTRMSLELATGHSADLSTAVAGDLSPLVSIQRDMKANAAYATANAEAALFATTMQASLEKVHASTSELGTALLEAGTLGHPMIIETTTADAKVKFEAVIGAFNTRAADRYAFSGSATDQKPLADAEIIVTALHGAIAGQTTATGVEAAVEAWFDDVGGGFATIGYTGSAVGMAPFRLSDSDTVDMPLTAADQGIRDILKGIAMAALVGENALSGDNAERAALARTAGQRMVNADNTLAVIRANVGSSEARIDQTSAQNAAEKLSLEIARNEITAIDPYKVATELEAVTFQLETLYTLTVRMSRLSLTEYLR